ncbi:threonine--tRNA ligase [Candidatus Woesearchaeota archaeon]|nr:threonine--tRNA ligase [Candidatus Woesearchaeota archaeon]
MPNIILKDGKKIRFRNPIKPMEIAEKISKGLSKKAIGALVNGELWDLQTPIKKESTVEIITSNSKQGLGIIRHSAAHVLAIAVTRLFPNVKLGMGPAIENGFYYDFDKKQPFRPGDLSKIEAEMQKVIDEDIPFDRIELTQARAKNMFKNEPYKLEMIADLSKITAYRTGKKFVDLCKGPHIQSTGGIKAFRLIKIAGAYWKGDVSRPQLQRIYGVAFAARKELEDYIHLMEEAEKRDHRKIGKELELYSFHAEAPGMAFIHSKGMIILNKILDYWRKEHNKAGYNEVRTPIVLSQKLWEQSGHWEHYKENMYFTKIDERDFAIKPMNCPGNILIFKEKLHSYKELPLRWAELGIVHRHELSGVLSGLFRVRQFVQDDAHIYCTEEDIEQEITAILDLTETIYKTFGLKFHVELSTRPENFMGKSDVWDKAEDILQKALKDKKIKYIVHSGEGTFYGPKIDFHVEDALGRTWQCGTIQLDFQMPEKFNITYEGKDGQRHRIIMLHRTVLGSLERFLGILVEHYAGKFPLWLAPEQVRILTVSDKFDKYAEQIKSELKEGGIRVYFDNRAETVGYKIRDAQAHKIPYIITIGEKEKKAKAISVRTRDNQVKFGVKLSPFIKNLLKEIEEKK